MIVTKDVATGRYRVKIDENVNGNRVRKTKLLPDGVTLETAYQIAERLIHGPLSFQDELAKAVAGKPVQRGSVYFIQNPSMPGLVKIGMTRRGVHERVRAMSTGQAYPWKIIGDGIMNHPDIVEETLHRHLAKYRETHNREFFRVSPAVAKAALDACMEVDGADLSFAINAIGKKKPV